MLGSAALGYLSVAQRLVQVTRDLAATALVPVSTVVFAKVRDSAGRLQSAYLKALSISYSAVSPMMTVVVSVGHSSSPCSSATVGSAFRWRRP